MIKGYIITMVNNHESTLATRQVIGSIKETQSEIDPIIFTATTPDTLAEDLRKIKSKSLLIIIFLKSAQVKKGKNTQEASSCLKNQLPQVVLSAMKTAF